VIFVSLFGTVRDALHGDTKLAQIIKPDMQNHVAVMKVRGVLTTVAERNRPSALG
jgi:hypothetical protein